MRHGRLGSLATVFDGKILYKFGAFGVHLLVDVNLVTFLSKEVKFMGVPWKG